MEAIEKRKDIITESFLKLLDRFLTKIFNLNIALGAFYIAGYSNSKILQDFPLFLFLSFVNIILVIVGEVIFLDRLAAQFNALSEGSKSAGVSSTLRTLTIFSLAFIAFSSIFLCSYVLWMAFEGFH